MEIISEKQFGLDLKTCIARDYNIELLKKVIRILETQGELPKAYKPHHLKGTKYLNKRIIDAHIENDWIILYRIKANRVYLIRTGTHADLFK